jgi:KDO2-lipid IV(A) lauroyltransferase
MRIVGDYLVFLIVRVLVCIVQCLSLETATAMAKGIARVVYLVDRRHRVVALDNLRIAFGDQYSESQRSRLVLAVYEHFCRVVVEIAFLPRRLRVYNWKRYARIEADPAAMDLLLQDRGRIFLTGHFGNWEMGGCLMAMIGLRTTTIARDLDNPFLHDFVHRFRSWSGQRMVSKKGEFDKIQQTLANRETLVSVADQSAGERGYFVPFFGRPASTHKAIALLALEHDAGVTLGYAYRDQPGFHYHIEMSRVIDPRDYQDDATGALSLTEDFTALLEQAVRKAPEQYLWLHNRWKHQPKQKTRRAAA